jgi:hypothetical protein
MFGLLQLSVEGAQRRPDLCHRRARPEAAIRIFGRHLADAFDEVLAATAAVFGAGLRPGHGSPPACGARHLNGPHQHLSRPKSPVRMAWLRLPLP